jgi:hypothetical protein
MKITGVHDYGHFDSGERSRMLLREGKGTVRPRTGHEGPEGEQMYTYTLSLTSALHEVGGQRHVPVALPPGKTWCPLH